MFYSVYSFHGMNKEKHQILHSNQYTTTFPTQRLTASLILVLLNPSGYDMNYYDEEIEIKTEKTSLRDVAKEGASSGINHRLNLMPTKPKQDSLVKDSSLSKTNDSFESDSEDLSKSEEAGQTPERLINSGKWKNISVPQEIKDCFQHILKYTPQTIDIEYHLQAFIPEFVPAVGDVDAFLKVSSPEVFDPNRSNEVSELIKKLGLDLLDEPSGNQSEPSLLSMKLHSVLTSARPSTMQVPVARSDKDIDKWVTEIDQLHMNQTHKRAADIQPLADIDSLMAEWPSNFEQALSKIGFPSADIDCSLSFYTKLLCTLFDIDITKNTQVQYITATHTLFNLYLAINNSLE